MTQNKTDEELALDLQSGDLTALGFLVTRYNGPLLNYVFGMCSDYHLSQDIVQECFMRVLSRIGQYRYPRPFRPWVFAIARNLLRDHLKSAAFRREVPWPDMSDNGTFKEDEEGVPCAGTTYPGRIKLPETAVNTAKSASLDDLVRSAEDVALDEWEKKQVLAAVRGLPDGLREVLMLRYFGELSLDDVAKALGLPVGTVKSRLSRAIHRLADALGKEGEAHARLPRWELSSR